MRNGTAVAGDSDNGSSGSSGDYHSTLPSSNINLLAARKRPRRQQQTAWRRRSPPPPPASASAGSLFEREDDEEEEEGKGGAGRRHGKKGRRRVVAADGGNNSSNNDDAVASGRLLVPLSAKSKKSTLLFAALCVPLFLCAGLLQVRLLQKQQQREAAAGLAADDYFSPAVAKWRFFAVQGKEGRPRRDEHQREAGAGADDPDDGDDHPDAGGSDDHSADAGDVAFNVDFDAHASARERDHKLIRGNAGGPYLLPPIGEFLAGGDDDIGGAGGGGGAYRNGTGNENGNGTLNGTGQKQRRRRRYPSKVVGRIPSDLLHYAVIGFGKCGTTTVNEWLRGHSTEVQALKSEVWALPRGDVTRLAARLYRKLPDSRKLRGYKCPGDILSDASLRLYQEHFPKTKFIVGVRHPVLWFQSLYNFRVQNFQSRIPPPNQLVGSSCGRKKKNKKKRGGTKNGGDDEDDLDSSGLTCTRRGFFAYYLMRLGKHLYRYANVSSSDSDGGGGNNAVVVVVPRRQLLASNATAGAGKRRLRNSKSDNDNRYFTPLERRISRYFGWKHELFPENVLDDEVSRAREVFLYDVHQLADDDEIRRSRLRDDLSSFLGLSKGGEGKKRLSTNATRMVPGRVYKSDRIQREKDSRKVNLCDPEHRAARSELMALARMSSEWIRKEFLRSPGVFVSNRDHLESLLETWMHDPCEEGRDGGIGNGNGPNFNKMMPETVSRDEDGGYDDDVDDDDGDDDDGDDDDDDDDDDDGHEALSFSRATNATTALAQSPKYGVSRPPLEALIDRRGNVVGDPQFLLDFAIIGFGKCGTSTLLQWLAAHPMTACRPTETFALMSKEPDRLIRTLYEELPSDRSDMHYHRCTKCPLDITQWYILDYYRTLFPQTRFVVGVRHPVLWFQSLYNFRAQTHAGFEEMVNPNELIGVCTRRSKMVCTRKGNFAGFLMRLGKQYHNGVRPFTDLEDKIANRYPRDGYDEDSIAYMPNEVFLYELGQLGDTDAARRDEFSRSIQSFLHLPQKLNGTVDVHVRPTKDWSPTEQALRDAKKIDICRDEYLPVRNELMDLARMSSTWIRETFLDLPGVHCASRGRFEELLLSWMHDPCDTADVRN